ncbi:MAG: cell division protein FtsW [Patescibacteria group bacterium]|nr:cell division protein FtsW [Patescibacteria group bacterium]
MENKEKIDNIFLGIVIALLVFGLFSFVSASFGILAKNEAKFAGVLFSQAVGLLTGLTLMYICSRIPYKFWRNYAFYFFTASLLITLLVFVPGLGQKHGGATRWIDIGGMSFQPVEFLKISFIFYFAGWLSWVKSKAKEIKYGILPLFVILAIVTAILVKQPDHKSIILIVLASGGMLIASGVPWKYILGAAGISLLIFAGMVISKDYLRDRVMTFLNPANDVMGTSYQLNQSLIAIGSGELFGRGLGKSVQKFTYLPEPQGDSIFAVIGEEFGFVGTSLLVILYIAFALRGMKIAFNAPDSFSRLMVVGLVILIVAQSFLNIASSLGAFPLTGVPLVFVSHGGTSLMFSLAVVGIILNISKQKVKSI